MTYHLSPQKKSYCYQVGIGLGQAIFGPTSSIVEGIENVPTTGSILFVSNHQSFLDPIFVSWAYSKRQIHYMAKEELFRVPTSGHMMRGLGAFPVDRSGPTKRTLVHVLGLLREGRCVCLFAEGTRSKDGRLRDFQPGFARLAKKTGTPVVPIALRGSRNLFENIQGMSLPIWSQIIKYPPPRARFGKPISPELLVDEIADLAFESVKSLLED